MMIWVKENIGQKLNAKQSQIIIWISLRFSIKIETKAKSW